MTGRRKTNNSNQTEDNNDLPEVKSKEELFIVDPFQGDINPGASADRALFNQATKSLEQSKRINATLGNAKQVRSHLEDLASKYGWGAIISDIQDSSGKGRNILAEYEHLTLEDAQRNAMEFLTDGSSTIVPANKECDDLDPKNDEDDKKKFCKKVRSRVISKTIEGHFSAATLTKLKNNSDKFRWKETNSQFFDEGLTMLFY